ncbi:MAG: hypothetical protein WCA96_08675 [Methylocella sp.]
MVKRPLVAPSLLLAKKMIALSRKDFFLPPESESAKRKYLYAPGT